MPEWDELRGGPWMMARFVTPEEGVGTVVVALCRRCGGYFGAMGVHRKFHEELDFLADTPRYRRWLRRQP